MGHTVNYTMYYRKKEIRRLFIFQWLHIYHMYVVDIYGMNQIGKKEIATESRENE